MRLSKRPLFIIFYFGPAVRDRVPNCKQRAPFFFEICNFVLSVGEWSLISAKWESYVSIVSLKVLFSNIVGGYQTYALPLNFHMLRFRKEKLILVLFLYFRSQNLKF
jgi:hypothetical protein